MLYYIYFYVILIQKLIKNLYNFRNKEISKKIKKRIKLIKLDSKTEASEEKIYINCPNLNRIPKKKVSLGSIKLRYCINIYNYINHYRFEKYLNVFNLNYVLF